MTEGVQQQIQQVEKQRPRLLVKNAEEEPTPGAVHRRQFLNRQVAILENPSGESVRNWLLRLHRDNPHGVESNHLLVVPHEKGVYIAERGGEFEDLESMHHNDLHRVMGGTGILNIRHRAIVHLHEGKPILQLYERERYADPALKEWANREGITVNATPKGFPAQPRVTQPKPPQEPDPPPSSSSPPKDSTPLSNVEEPDLPAHQVEESHIHPDAWRTLKRRGIVDQAHLLHVLGAPPHLPIESHKTWAEKQPGLSPLVHTQVISPDYWMQRTIDATHGVVHNRDLHTTTTGTGLGSQILHGQIEHLSNLGFRQIRTFAARNATIGPGFNGYYTMALHGFRGEFSPNERNKLPPEFRHVDNTNDLFLEPGGRPWWKKNGWEKPMVFHLRPGSVSHRLHELYMQERAMRPPSDRPTGNADYGPQFNEGVEDLSLSPQDEAALEAAWDRLAQEEKSKKERLRRQYDFEDIGLSPEEKLEAIDELNRLEGGQTHNQEEDDDEEEDSDLEGDKEDQEGDEEDSDLEGDEEEDDDEDGGEGVELHGDYSGENDAFPPEDDEEDHPWHLEEPTENVKKARKAEKKARKEGPARGEIHSHDTSGGKWVTTRQGKHLHHRIHTPPRDADRSSKKKGKPPTRPINIVERADPRHLTPEQQKHQDVLHYHQYHLLQKINKGEGSHDDHKRFGEIRDRLNEFHEYADLNREDRELLEKEDEENTQLEKDNWEYRRDTDQVDPEDLATRELREKQAKRRNKLAKKRAKKKKKHYE
jgi:hypothetical protein